MEGSKISAGGTVMESNDQALTPSAQPAAIATPSAVVSAISGRAENNIAIRDSWKNKEVHTDWDTN